MSLPARSSTTGAPALSRRKRENALSRRPDRDLRVPSACRHAEENGETLLRECFEQRACLRLAVSLGRTFGDRGERGARLGEATEANQAERPVVARLRREPF